MFLALLMTGCLSASPALYTLKAAGGLCNIVERRPPGWKPRTVVQLKRCLPDKFLWSPDGRRALVEEPEPFLVDIYSRKRTALPRPRGEGDGFAFGKDGRVYAFSMDKPHDRGILSVLEGGRFREVESTSLARHEQEPWGSFLSNSWHSDLQSIPDLALAFTQSSDDPTQAEAKLLSSLHVEGASWRVIRSSGANLAFQSCGTDACFGACTPILILRENQAIKLPLAEGALDECLSVQAARDLVLVQRNVGAFFFDARTGALLLEVPADEKLAKLSEQ